jgi:hypothetical protein
MSRRLDPAVRNAILNARATMTHLEIAAHLDVPFGTVKSVVFRAAQDGDPRAAKMDRFEIEARRAPRRLVGVRTAEARAKITAANLRRFAAARGETWSDRMEREAEYLDIPVPGWVERAGLDLEYLSIAETRGEEEAASHCRRLKALRQIPVQTAGYPSVVSPPQNCAPARREAGRGDFLRGGE